MDPFSSVDGTTRVGRVWGGPGDGSGWSRNGDRWRGNLEVVFK